MRRLPNICADEESVSRPFNTADVISSLRKRKKRGNNDDDGVPQKELPCRYGTGYDPERTADDFQF